LLFFFAGHLLESSVIPLELYFEHRNYLPALLLGWPLARAVCAWRAPVPARAAVAIAMLGLLAAITWQRAGLWGQPQRLALLWAAQNPASPRAQATAAMAELQAGRPDLALRRLDPLLRQQPHELQWALNHADAACAQGGLDAAGMETVADALRHARYGQHLAWRWLDAKMEVAESHRCPGMDHDTLERWLHALTANPIMQRLPGRRQDAAALAGRLALVRGQPDAALAHFDRALAVYVTPDAATRQAALLAQQGHYRQALAHLDHYDRLAVRRERATGWNMSRLHQWVLDRQGYWPRELAILRDTLQADLAAQARTAQPSAP
jgi:tetratricopeptide (TPR) repeat protein